MSIKVYDAIEQGSEAWFRLKWGKIGGTASKGLFVNSDTLFLDIFSQHTEDYENDDGFSSADMLRGQELEPVARKLLSSYTGVNFIEVGWIENEIRTLLGISPDGITYDYTIACEIKCLGRKLHNDIVLSNKISKEHIHQCVHYFTANPKLQKLYYCCFRPEHKFVPLFVKELTRNSLVDLGLIKKGKIKEDRGHGLKDYVCSLPDMRPIEEFVLTSNAAYDKLEVRITESLKKLEF